MDTQKMMRKYLWYELIANLCSGLIAIINNIDNAMKAGTLKPIVSTVGFINVILFIIFTIKSRRLDGFSDKLSKDYMRYDLMLSAITLLFVFFQIIMLNIRFEILFALTIVWEFGFIFNMTLEYKFFQNRKGDNNGKEQESPQMDK